MSFVVVVFGGRADPWCELSHCPMHAHGPYASRELAEGAAAMVPGWMRPHILSVDGDDACLGGPAAGIAART